MKLRRFTVTLGVIAALAIRVVDRQSAAAAPPPDEIFSEEIDVTLRITGLAYLIGEPGAKERLLVIPNQQSADHVLLVMVDSNKFTSELLDETRTVEASEITYAYGVFPDGYEVDLAASGWVPPPTMGTLVADETGDLISGAACPDTAPPDSLHWLPRMSQVNHSPVVVKHSYKAKDPNPKEVLARLEITDGQLTAHLPPSPRKFRFETTASTSGDPDVVQAVADYLDYTFKARVVNGQPFVLKARRFRSRKSDPEEWKEIVRVTPVNKVVEITLANVVEDSFFYPEKSNVIGHFSHLYDAFYKPAKNVQRVVVAGTCSGGNDSGVECGPIRP